LLAMSGRQIGDLGHIGPKTHWLFVCRGNIARSALAEAWWQAHGLGEARSAGTLGTEGRVPPLAWRHAVFAQTNLDLAGHRSRALTPALMRWADIVVAMDVSVLNDVGDTARHFGIQRPRVLITASGVDDPALQGPSAMLRICKQVTDALEALTYIVAALRAPAR
jgi:protein-tyrosine-phosphatase